MKIFEGQQFTITGAAVLIAKFDSEYDGNKANHPGAFVDQVERSAGETGSAQQLDAFPNISRRFEARRSRHRCRVDKVKRS
jgi:hypothetical protein